MRPSSTSQDKQKSKTYPRNIGRLATLINCVQRMQIGNSRKPDLGQDVIRKGLFI